MQELIKIIGIEGTCDNMSFVLLNNYKTIYYYRNYCDMNMLINYGGIYPDYCSKSLIKYFSYIMYDLKFILNHVNYIAVSWCPGLITSLHITRAIGMAISKLYNIKIIKVNHVHAHITSIRFNYNISYPFFGLIISGGSCIMYYVVQAYDMRVVLKNLNNTIGQVVDNIAKYLGLLPPTGKSIEHYAKNGNIDNRFVINKFDNAINTFSWSGFLSNFINKIIKYQDFIIADVCYTLQYNICNYLFYKIKNINNKYNIKNLIMSGGVATNDFIRNVLTKMLLSINIKLYCVNSLITSDNAIMIAWHGLELLNNDINNIFIS